MQNTTVCPNEELRNRTIDFLKFVFKRKGKFKIYEGSFECPSMSILFILL